MSSRPPLPFGTKSHYAGAYGASVKLYRANRYGQIFDEIALPTVSGGSIVHSDDAETPRVLNINVEDPNEIREFKDFVVPEITLTRADGTSETGRFGVFAVLPPSTNFGMSHRLSGSIEAKDLTWILLKSSTPVRTFPAGMDVGAACREIAYGAGFIEAQIDLPDTGYKLKEKYRVKPGDSRLATMNELYTMASWHKVYMSSAGKLKSRKEVLLEQRTPRKIYSNRGEVVEILPDIKRTSDISGLRNRVSVRKLSSDDETPDIFATARIENRNHPLFYDPSNPLNGNFPYELYNGPTDVSEIETQAQANEAAKLELAKASSRIEKLSLKTVVDVKADAYDVLGLDVYSGNNPIYDGSWWREGWTIAIDGVVSTIECQLYRVEPIS